MTDRPIFKTRVRPSFQTIHGLPSDRDEFLRYPVVLEMLNTRIALAALGVRTWGDFEAITETKLLKEGVGRKGVNMLKDTLVRHGTQLGARWQEPPLPARLYREVVIGVYFIQCEPFIKIGYATNVRKRLGHIELASPFQLLLPAVISCETEAEARQIEREHHQRFRQLHYRGEWFRYEGELLAYVRLLQEKAADGEAA